MVTFSIFSDNPAVKIQFTGPGDDVNVIMFGACRIDPVQTLCGDKRIGFAHYLVNNVLVPVIALG